MIDRTAMPQAQQEASVLGALCVMLGVQTVPMSHKKVAIV